MGLVRPRTIQLVFGPFWEYKYKETAIKVCLFEKAERKSYRMSKEPPLCWGESKEKQLSKWTQEDFVQLICAGCEFYKPQEEKLECAAFKILIRLLKSEVISVAQVKNG